MKLELIRDSSDKQRTLGHINLDTQRQCYTVEDEYRAVKVMDETRIPEGTYAIKLRTVGRFHEKFLEKFGAHFHRGMLWLQDVPGFEFILIHTGNTDGDTSGCIIVGEQRLPTGVGASAAAYKALYPKVRDAILRGEATTITITDADRHA